MLSHPRCIAVGVVTALTSAVIATAGLGVTSQCAVADQQDTFAPEDIAADTWTLDLDCVVCHTSEASEDKAMVSATGAKGEQTADATDVGGTPTSVKDATDVPEGGKATLEVATPIAPLHESMGLDCIVCHADTDKLTDVHTSAKKLSKNAKRLKKTSVGEEVCVTCHAPEDLAKATASSTVLTDAEGTVVNPHDLPQNGSHDTVTCVTCHSAHDAEAELAVDAQSACGGCHHEEIYACYTCHE